MTLTELARSAVRMPDRPAPATVATGFGFGLLLVGVVIMHGFVWGESQPMVQTILDSGAIQCLHDQGWAALSAKCDSVGQPIGLTFLTGMPEIMLGWALSWIPGVDAWTAHQLLNVILDAVALGGGYLLLRRWDVVRGIALVGSAVYLVTPSLIGLNGFQYTFTGYTFLPLYVLLFLVGLDGFANERGWRVGVIYLVVDTFLMVFTDGYSYATALLLLGVVLISWLWRNTGTSRKRKATAAAVFVIANLVAVGAYVSYTNASADPDARLGQFRYYSLDPATLFIPVRRLLWPSHLGYHTPTLNLYGDGGNDLFNYMGFIMMALLVWLFVARRMRSQPMAQRYELIALTIAALLALFLSFGPGLKFFTEVNPSVPVGDVPASEMLFSLPTSILYAHVHPFNDMRADFRWSVGFRFVLVFAATYAVNLIWKAEKRAIATGLLLLASMEVVPAPGLQMHITQGQSKQIHQVRTSVVDEFDRLTTSGDRVLMLPSSNDFLANAMAPFAGVSTYNVGIDKSYRASSRAWPREVKRAAAGVRNVNGEGDRLSAVLDQHATVIVICYFSLLHGGTFWPAPRSDAAALHTAVDVLAKDSRFIVRRGSSMATIRLRDA